MPRKKLNISREYKVCSRCKRLLPRSAFNKCSTTADGLQYYCKDCQREYRKMRAKTKVCSECGKRKPLSEFPEARGTPDGRFHICKQCIEEMQGSHPKSSAKHYRHYFSAILINTR